MISGVSAKGIEFMTSESKALKQDCQYQLQRVKIGFLYGLKIYGCNVAIQRVLKKLRVKQEVVKKRGGE